MTLRVLHITPHLGCGVGRVLSQVAGFHTMHATGVEERFVSLERAQKMQFVDAIIATGAPVFFDICEYALRKQLAWADIVQLEWWHHPAMAQWLHAQQVMTGRLAIWAHTSGLHYPCFSSELAHLPHAMMATTAASPVGIAVPSSGGFDDIPVRYESAARSLGASSFYAFYSVTLPLARKGLLSTTLLIWAKAMGEFGASITLAGTMSFKTETLPTAIFMQLASADIEGAMSLIFIMLVVGLSALFLGRLLWRRN